MIPAWQAHSACSTTDADLWFPEGNDALSVYAQARKICRRCPVAAPCLMLGMEPGNIDHGMFGGHTPRERQRLRRRLHVIAA